jgi:predicted Zn-dependent protease
MGVISEQELKHLADTALSMSHADQTEVVIFSPHSALTRFANNYIHQNVEQQDIDVRVRAVLGKEIGVASSNDVSDDGLRAVVERAETLARHQKENPDFTSLPGPSPIPHVEGYVEGTARTGPEQRASVVGKVCAAASRAGLTAAGAFRTSVASVAVANSLGVFAYARDTMADINTVIMSDQGSGHAARTSMDVSEIDGAALAAEAIDKAERNVEQIELPPGEYDVVFQDYAVTDILDFFSYLSFGAQAVQEKRSFMAGRFGERVMGENISIWDDGLSPDTLPNPFDFEGVPRERVTFIEQGVARDVVWDSYTAGKEGRQSTGHALPAGNTFGPIPSNLFLGTGDSTIDDMVASTKLGVWVSRFWYTRPVHPLNVVVTGMTRDGTFLIEDGKVTSPIRNLRFTHSYLEAMNQVEAIGRTATLQQSDILGVNRVPPIKVRGWTFTGVSEY